MNKLEKDLNQILNQNSYNGLKMSEIKLRASNCKMSVKEYIKYWINMGLAPDAMVKQN